MGCHMRLEQRSCLEGCFSWCWLRVERVEKGRLQFCHQKIFRHLVLRATDLKYFEQTSRDVRAPGHDSTTLCYRQRASTESANARLSIVLEFHSLSHTISTCPACLKAKKSHQRCTLRARFILCEAPYFGWIRDTNRVL
jgi:hypothetical protein